MKHDLLLDELYLRQRRPLLAVLTRIVRNPQTAEDLAQEAYLRVSRALEIGTIAHPDAFLHRTARNLALDHERQRRRRSRYEVRDASPEVIQSVADDQRAAEDRLQDREREAALRAVIAALPPRARQAWQLCYVEGRSYAEIADRLGVSRNTVYNDVKLCLGRCHDTLARMERG